MTERMNNIICWSGFGCSIGSYLMLNLHVILSNSAVFIAMNCLAALFFGFAAFNKKLNAIVAQNVAWFCITLIGAYRAFVS